MPRNELGGNTLLHLRCHAESLSGLGSGVVADPDTGGEGLTALRNFLSGQGATGYGVRERGEREHFHFALRCDKTLPTFRKALIRAFPSLSGNRSYSLETARDWERLRRYLAKGSDKDSAPDVVWRSGLYPDEYVKVWHDEYWAENATIAAAKRKASNMMAELEERCRSKRVAWDDRDSITEEYATVVKDFGKTYDVNLARRTVRGVMIALCPNDSYRRSMVEQTWY